MPSIYSVYQELFNYPRATGGTRTAFGLGIGHTLRIVAGA